MCLQMTNNLVSQANTMNLGLNPQRYGCQLKSNFYRHRHPYYGFHRLPRPPQDGCEFYPYQEDHRRVCLSSFAMVSACVIQHYIYTMSKCGYNINK